MKCCLALLTSIFLWLPAIGQNDLPEAERILQKTAQRLMMSDTLSQRRQAFADLVGQLQTALTLEHSFDYPFDSLKEVSIQLAPDSSFRIFTGQLYIDEDHYQYYGLIQMRDDAANPIVLTDQSDQVADLEGDFLSKEYWYGAVYYNIKSFSNDGKTFYVLFGFDAHKMFENRKVAEVFYFENKEVRFGAPVFLEEHGLVKNRLVVQYAADVSIKVNFDEDLQMIIFDNLIPMKSPYREKKIAMVPDGSYRGYQLDQMGNWQYIDKIFHTTLAEPPREHPVLDGEAAEKDLFGKKKNRR